MLPKDDGSTRIRIELPLGPEGLKFTYRNGQSSRYFSIIETLGGGVAILDFDRDGREDVFLTGGGFWLNRTTVAGHPHGLCWNRAALSLINIATHAMLADDQSYSFGASAVDYDQDGFGDLHVTGLHSHQLYRNQGDGTFEEATEACFSENSGWSSSSAWADYNRDGLPDVYIAHYIDWAAEKEPVCIASHGERDVCGPNEFQGQPDQLWLQDGTGAFVNASKNVDVAVGSRGLGVAAGDWNHDGLIDLYVANDANPNFYLKNLGEGQFTEIGFPSGTSLGSKSFPDGSMGVGIGDFDGNLLVDLLVTNFDGQYMELYANQGSHYFRNLTRTVGLMALGNSTVGWGVVWTDADHDGDEDLMYLAGHPSYGSAHRRSEQAPVFLENDSNKRMVSIGAKMSNFFVQPIQGRGLAIADLDLDGDCDAVASIIGQPAQILENRSQHLGHYLQLELVGTISNRDAIGTYVLCYADSKAWIRHRFGGGSYASTSSPVLHFGLGAATKATRIEIHWPSGKIIELLDVPVDQRLVVVEPR